MLPENHFYEASTTGSIVGMCYPPLPSTGYSHYRGIAYVDDPLYGDCLWAYAAQNENGPPTIIKMKAIGTGSIVSSFPVYGGYKGGGGLALDESGGHLYHLDYVGYKIYKYTTAGSVVTSFDTPDKNAKDRLPYGLAYDGQYLWVTCYGKYDRIVKMTTTGSIITGGIFPVPNTPNPHPTAITADGTYLRYIDDATETFYQVDK
jgi:sugar lactone lactonase YvrE